jgi:hypothetical protein
MVRDRPLRPLKLHNSTTLDRCRELCICSSYMADDVWCGVERGVHKAVAEILRRKPAYSDRRRILILIFGTVAFIAKLYQLKVLILI